MTATRTIKQTAGNNALLARVKRIFNAGIFKRASEILNAEGDGAARTYLANFHRDTTDAGLDAFIAEYLSR